MKKIAAALLAPIIIFCHFGAVVSAEEVSLNISAPSAILMEASTGQVIYEKNAEERLHPASITKIMTLLLIFEALEEGKISLTDEVTTSAYAKSMGAPRCFWRKGKYRQLIH